MTDILTLSVESVPTVYLEDSLPNIQTEYGIKLFTKSAPDEKEISQVYITETRIGWLIPVLSIISLEHDQSENIYFRKHVYEAMKILNNKSFPESVYVLVYSKRLLNSANVESDGELSLSFLLFGVYPYYNSPSLTNIENKKKIEKKLVITKSFNFDFSVGFFKFFSSDFLPTERNGYARFMFCYQVYELAMEMVFYKKVNELKITRSHLGIIRKKIDDYSSEGKLINILYGEMGREKNDPSLSAVARTIFEDVKDEAYYTSTNRSSMLYDIRNTLVHSYYRHNVEENLSYLSSYIEDEVFYVLNYLYSIQEMRVEMEGKYFHAAS
ncbi:hypothetical protein H5A35_21575 [Pectobacterium brasiliense]|uniref:hypothetical protein n=1 Tax=Pectobacterium brasiliense TaxID=180957 RepID=UPI0019692B48|nr:hypothetical protein [Pectobacterium brasiliense]MBN3209989.1 hypothetical protein [Pectobacterium brasiliense]